MFHVSQCHASYGECEDLRVFCKLLYVLSYEALGRVPFDDASVVVPTLFYFCLV